MMVCFRWREKVFELLVQLKSTSISASQESARYMTKVYYPQCYDDWISCYDDWIALFFLMLFVLIVAIITAIIVCLV